MHTVKGLLFKIVFPIDFFLSVHEELFYFKMVNNYIGLSGKGLEY